MEKVLNYVYNLKSFKFVATYCCTLNDEDGGNGQIFIIVNNVSIHDSKKET